MIAHEAVTPAGVWSAWTLDPVVVLGLAGAAFVYGRGFVRLRRRGRPSTADRRAAAFVTAMLVLVAALVSPLDAMAEALFSAHMVQHLLLIVVAAPLLVAARPVRTSLAALPVGPRRTVAALAASVAHSSAVRTLRRPAAAWTLLTIGLWAWHTPSLYSAAFERTPVHALEHVVFLSTSALAWSVALDRRQGAPLGAVGRALFLLATAVQAGLLGAVLLFASSPLYAVHGGGPSAWGLTPLQDQQLAGALMWIPPSAVYLAAAGAILSRPLRTPPVTPAPATRERVTA